MCELTLEAAGFDQNGNPIQSEREQLRVRWKEIMGEDMPSVITENDAKIMLPVVRQLDSIDAMIQDTNALLRGDK